MRSANLLQVLIASGSLLSAQTAISQDQPVGQDVGQMIQGFSNKAIKCQQTGNSDCSKACMKAIELVRSGPSSQLDEATKACDSGFAALQAKREEKLAAPPLREGYAWMPDIEATVVRARGAPFLVEGRDSDWGTYCTGRVRFGGAANDAESKKLMRAPGTRVILKHVQHPTTRVGVMGCVIGDVVAQ